MTATSSMIATSRPDRSLTTRPREIIGKEEPFLGLKQVSETDLREVLSLSLQMG